MRKLFHFIWGLPQNLVGLVLYLIYRGKHRTRRYGDAYVCEVPNLGGSVSLGLFILTDSFEHQETIMHEYGHTKQSMLLGPLYLLIVGLPSFLWAKLGRSYREKHGVSYFSFYTERWADKWAGVKRG